MKGKLLTLAVVVLALFSVFNFVQGLNDRNSIKDLKSSIDQNTNKTIVFNGKDGNTPVKGIDYFDGADGISTMSYSTVTVKEVPLVGKSTYDLWLEAGNTGTIDDFLTSLKGVGVTVRMNPDTGDFETKSDKDKFWSVQIPCNQLQIGCPDVY